MAKFGQAEGLGDQRWPAWPSVELDDSIDGSSRSEKLWKAPPEHAGTMRS